jgi:hypothetical protein
VSHAVARLSPDQSLRGSSPPRRSMHGRRPATENACILRRKGTRILVKSVLYYVAQGKDWGWITTECFGRVNRAAIAEAVELAARALTKRGQGAARGDGQTAPNGMNVLDENSLLSQRDHLRAWKVHCVSHASPTHGQSRTCLPQRRELLATA